MKIKLLKITAMVALMLTAMTLGQAQVPITVEQGWNWISYPYSEPMSVAEALSGITPAEGDMLKSQSDGFAQYQNGAWTGSLTMLIPGKGYKYESVDGTTKTFVFGGAANDPSALPEEALSGEFKVNANGTKVRFSPGNLQCRINPTQETQAVVGMGTGTTGYMPYNTYYKYSLCQMIYKAEELYAAGLTLGTITNIAFESYSSNHFLRNGITVWMSPTTLSSAPSTSVSTMGMTQVFSGSLIQQDGWTPIYFSMPFTWDGTSDLMVTVVMNHGSWESTTQWQCSSPGFTCSNYKYNDSNTYDPGSSTYSMSTSTKRANTRFNIKGGVTWRFAANQWDYVGEGNANASGAYNGWIDMFGWGTSGHPHGANSFLPWSTSTSSSDYYAYGDASYNLCDQTGEADWGCNAISNGGGKPNQWRTLTSEEWDYMLNTRSGKRYAKATVADVNGMIVLPDGWKTSYYSLSNTNTANAAFSSNIITADQWQTLEQHGAVFLPATGYRNGNTMYDVGTYGNYWSTTNDGTSNAYSFDFDNTFVMVSRSLNRKYGESVRLVCQTNPRIRTISVTNVTATGATVNVEVDWTSTTVPDRGICFNTTGNPQLSQGYTPSGTGTGSFNVTMTGLQPNTTYYVRSFAHISGSYRFGNTLTFTTLDDSCNGHAYVDLGLPSGLLWATCNIGATTPEGYGNYYAWGETSTKSTYNWNNYQYCNGDNDQLTKYCTNSDFGYNGFVDNLTTLFPEDDAATANWGSGWRMPTQEEFQELLDNTTVTWTTQNGVNGRLFTAANGNSLFLPAAGFRNGSTLYYAGNDAYYWSSSLDTDYPYLANILYFYPNSFYMNNDFRYQGEPVRPVRPACQN